MQNVKKTHGVPRHICLICIESESLEKTRNFLKFPISTILKIEQCGFLHFVLCFDTNKSAGLDF